jgi:hypothetical protein
MLGPVAAAKENRITETVRRALTFFDLPRLELIVMLLLALGSFLGAPFYVTFAAAALLTCSTLYEYAHLQPRFEKRGGSRLLIGGLLLAAIMSFSFAALCFAIGRFFAWLIAA